MAVSGRGAPARAPEPLSIPTAAETWPGLPGGLYPMHFLNFWYTYVRVLPHSQVLLAYLRPNNCIGVHEFSRARTEIDIGPVDLHPPSTTFDIHVMFSYVV